MNDVTQGVTPENETYKIMNKKILAAIIVFDTFLTFILVTRFVAIDRPWPASEEKPPACAPADSAFCRNQAVIGKAYTEKIKPVFQKKCFACHGTVEKAPLYAVVPPASLLLKHDTAEAKEHLDMTFDYPFAGEHAKTPAELFKALDEVISKNLMPPFRYKLMHWQSGLTGDERKMILEWVGESRALLPKNGRSKDEPHHNHNHPH